MNIFILDKDVKKCAQYHCDKHVVKMILESAQILSTVIRKNGIDFGYKPTHLNHPCTIWAGDSLSNWKWLCKLANALNQEYKYRYEKKNNHKSFNLIQSMPVPQIKDVGLSSFKLVMPKKYWNINPVTAYRNYYMGEKTSILNWTKRPAPFWVS